jgi:2-polyprenyl-3-methyl-5-hydroxy-6-metoxy-1,4-benzoquinol methylase
MKKTMQWSVDEYDENGKLIILYRFQRVLDHSIIKGGDLVLDVGGWGKLEKRLSQEDCIVDMINIDNEECDRVRSWYGDSFNIINGDIRNSNLGSNKYDVVACFETLEHIRERRTLAISEMFRVLKPGGKFVGTIPIPGRCHPVDDPTVTFITPDELRNILDLFATDIRIDPIGSITPDENPPSWFFVSTKKEK